jgi:hypothetical protein
LDEIKVVQDAHKNEVAYSLKQRQDIMEWANYIACGPLPNPKIEADVNTFLALWEDEPFSNSEHVNLDDIIKQIPIANTLLEQLELERGLSIDISNPKRFHIIHQQMLKLIEILFNKWDQTTQKILQRKNKLSYRYGLFFTRTK